MKGCRDLLTIYVQATSFPEVSTPYVGKGIAERACVEPNKSN